MNTTEHTHSDLQKELAFLRARVRELESSAENDDGSGLSDVIIENAPIGLYLANAEGRFLKINPALIRMLGFSSKDDLLSLNLENEQFGNLYLRSRFKDILEREGTVHGNESAITLPDGKKKYIRESVHIIRDEQGKPKFFEGTVEDITERKRFETALEVSENRYRLLAANIPGINVYLYNNDLELIVAEGADIRQSGLEPAALEGKRIEEILNEETFRQVAPHYRAALEGKSSSLEFSYRNTRYFLQVLPLQDDDGEVYGGLAVIQNTTERKKLEESFHRTTSENEKIRELLEERGNELININRKLRESEQQLASLNASKDKFFSIIAHDLRGPFQGFLSLTEYLASSAETMTMDEIKEFADQMNETTKNMYNLIENLLQWSRLQIGKLQVQESVFGLKQKVSYVMDLYKDVANQKQITMHNSIEERILVRADLNMIDTVIRNLLSNALKFTAEGGTVTVSAAALDDQVEVAVSDTGVGIGETTRKKLFRLDEHVSTKGTNREKGTGIGLKLCKEFVEENKGSIRVESRPGEGSKFCFTLPAAQHRLMDAAERHTDG